MRAKERAVLVGIVVVVAAVVRIAFVSTGRVLSPLRADAGEYAQYAANLVTHGTYSLAQSVPPPPDSFRSPGYGLLLAACRLGGGQAWQTVAIALQVLLGTLTVLLCYRLARRSVGFAAALAAGALAALSPHLVVSSGFVLTECLTTFLVTCGLWLCLCASGAVRFACGAAVLGFAALCNEVYMFVPVVVAMAAWRQDRRRLWLALVIGLLPTVAWSLRNASTELARTGGQRAVASVSHGSYPGMVYGESKWFGYPYREDPEQPAMASSWAALWAVLGPRIAADPLRYARWYVLEKPIWLWSWPLVQGRDVCVYEVADSPYERQPVMQASHTLMRWLHLPVMLLAAITAVGGLRPSRRDGVPGQRALAAIVVLATLAYLPVIPDPRYLQPVRPLLFVLAAVGAEALVVRLFVNRRRVPAAASPPSALTDG
ncbi:MAG: glycosyltransferase family 39 protein [Planctomycetes bacterium]|nr:glycosyltransferase family 39 protein [Planctomycetota bacterium]